MNKTKKVKKNNNLISKTKKCNEFLETNKNIVTKYLENIYYSIDDLCNKNNINFSKNVNLNNLIEKICSLLEKKKGNLQPLSNVLFSNLQYFNISGFDLVKIINNKEKAIKSSTLDKLLWNKAIFSLLNIISNYEKTSKTIMLLNEQYELNASPSNNNSNQNEFEVYYNNKKINTNKNYLDNEEQIYHNYYDNKINKDKIRYVNIHSTSGLKQNMLINKIIDFLNKFPKNNNKYLVLGGDSNVYYNKGLDDSEKKWCNEGLKNINSFASKLFKLGYITLLSKHIVFKTRPYNFFNNAQASFKYGDEPVETMFISLPIELYKKYKNNGFFYDKDNYFLCLNDNDKFRKIKNTDIYENKLNAFQGSEHISKNGILKVYYSDIFDYKNGGALISDHVPIYLNIGDTKIIYSNNASLLGSRGINNTIDNKNKWKKSLLLKPNMQNDINVNKNNMFLNKLSNKIVKILLKNSINMLRELKIDINNLNKYNNDKEKLKYLTNLQVCIV